MGRRLEKRHAGENHAVLQADLNEHIICSLCDHPAALHREDGCSVHTRGDNMLVPRPCDCARNDVQARDTGRAAGGVT
ncbi:MAG: hypothetical protein NVSMB19_19250 [Vulcanimicrobiaceae bacterium]